MNWLDHPVCGNETCGGANAGSAVISNMNVSNMVLPARHGMTQHFPMPEHVPSPAPTPRQVRTQTGASTPSWAHDSNVPKSGGNWLKTTPVGIARPVDRPAKDRVEEDHEDAPQSTGTPWWVVAFVWVSIVQSCMLCALGAFTYRLHQRVGWPSRHGHAGSPRR